MAEEQEEVVNTVSEDLAAAWDQFEESEEKEDVQLSEPVTEDEPADAESDGDTVAERSDTEDPAGVSGSEKSPESQPAESSDSPPVGLSASAREVWKDAPKALKDELKKREKDYATGIQKYAESAQRATAMDKALAPHHQLFAMNGGAQNTLPGLLQTASILQMGSPPQKAEMVAGLIKQFGVDIHALDGILSGQAPQAAPRGTPQPDVQQLVDQRMQQYQQQQQQVQNQQSMHEVNNDLQTFANDPNNEFYRDVSSIMADQLEIAAKNNKTMDLPEAYRIGCMLHPEVSNIVATRKGTPSGSKRRAAKSIHGSPSGQGGGNEGNMSMTDAINAAWDAQGRA